MQIIKTGRVVRAMCILSHPIPGTADSHSAQIILPQKQVGRRSDIYVFCCSYTHNVVPKDKWIAFVSTTVETNNPAAELGPGLALLGHVDEKFVEVVDLYEPLDDGTQYVFVVLYCIDGGKEFSVVYCSTCIAHSYTTIHPKMPSYIHSYVLL